jgi:hypothetical protein
LTLLVPAAPAHAASVSIVDFAFSPATAKAVQGDTVTWTNEGIFTHTATQDGPLALWDSHAIVPGDTFDVRLPAAGSYPYHCTVHGMPATVRIPLIVDQTAGSTATVFTFTLASENQYGFRYDVQKKVNGDWKDWKVGVTGPKVQFQAAKAGTMWFRSRLRRLSDDAATDWSPKTKIVVVES